jgi:hypothetical protein
MQNCQSDVSLFSAKIAGPSHGKLLRAWHHRSTNEDRNYPNISLQSCFDLDAKEIAGVVKTASAFFVLRIWR